METLSLDAVDPLDGHDRFEFAFPNTDRGTHHLQLALGVPQYLDIEGIFAGYDSSIVHASNFDPSDGVALSLYEQTLKMLARLKDPIFMTPVNRDMCQRFIRNHIEEICLDVARHDDRAAIDQLVEFGFINGDNIARIVERVGALQDASITSYLLTIKRERFGAAAMDFSL